MSDSSYHVIQLQLSNSVLDLIQGRLYDLGCLGLIEESTQEDQILLKAYFSDQQPLKILKKQIENATGYAPIQADSIRLNASQFQAAAFDPIRLAGDYWIVPPEDLSQPTDANVVPEQAKHIMIRPGMAFGTGRHETTQLCAEAILSLDPKPNSLLDVGTGSGILAILAKQCGIPKVAAVEISEDARANAEENLQLNGIQDVTIYEDIEQVSDTYDAVVANILTPTLIQIKNLLMAQLTPKGTLILSGVTIGEDQSIERAFSNLKLIQKREHDGWYCFIFHSHADPSHPR